jgi:hypothetical protein
LSDRPAQRFGAAAGGTGSGAVLVRAGCGRSRTVPSDAAAARGAPAVWAYLELAFVECPTCPHRVVPEGAAPFCAWRPDGTPHPFAVLEGWDVGS